MQLAFYKDVADWMVASYIHLSLSIDLPNISISYLSIYLSIYLFYLSIYLDFNLYTYIDTTTHFGDLKVLLFYPESRLFSPE